jgi:hypothetical protein
MIGRAARNIGGEVVMYADTVTESMRVAIDETNRRRAIQVGYNTAHGIEPTTIVKEIHDINERLRSVAESTTVYVSAGERGERIGGVDLAAATTVQVEALVTRLETEMRAAAKNLEFERAAALRDQIQSIRLRVLEQDASAAVAKAAEQAAAPPPGSTARVPASKAARARAAAEAREGEVTRVVVVPLAEGGDGGDDGRAMDAGGSEIAAATVSDWLPGIRDEHEEEGGWQARWIERPTWDRTVTPNVRRRTGRRPPRR